MSPTLPHRPLRVQSDARLLQLARRGESAAFEALVRRYRRQLHGYCRRLGLGDAQAEDALQQGLLHAWRALLRGDDVRDVKSWMYRIVHNTALDVLRRIGNENVELDERLHGHVEASAAGELDRRLAMHATLTELAALPHMQREALVRTAVHGDSHEQVASALGLSHTAVRGLVHRARIAMRAAAGALIPGRLLQWLVRWGPEVGSAGTPELGSGGAGGGMLSVFAKSGAILATGGVLAGGIATIQHIHTSGGHVAGQRAGGAAPAAAGSTAVSGYAGGSGASGEHLLLASTGQPKGEITSSGGALHLRPPRAQADRLPSVDRWTASAPTTAPPQKQAPMASSTQPPISRGVSSAGHPSSRQGPPATSRGEAKQTAHGDSEGHSHGANVSGGAEGGSSSNQNSGVNSLGAGQPGNSGKENRGADSSNAHIADSSAKGHETGSSEGKPGSSEDDLGNASSNEQAEDTQSGGSPERNNEPQGKGQGLGKGAVGTKGEEGSQGGSSKHGS